MHKKRIILPILLVIALLAAAYWYVTTQRAATETGVLSGSGTVEATMVTVAPEIFGRIADVLVEQGDAVSAGEVLFRLDGAIQDAQLNQAQINLEAATLGLDVVNDSYEAALAAVDIAQAQYNLALAQALQQAQTARRVAWEQLLPAEIDLPAWYYTQAEQLSAALEEMDSARSSLEAEQSSFDELRTTENYTKLTTVEVRLVQARLAFLNARDVLLRAEQQEDQSLVDAAQEAYDITLDELESAQQAYDDLLSSQEATHIVEVRARLAVAQERYDTAQDRYNALLTGRDSLAVQVAAATLRQAQINVTLAESKLIQAQAAVEQAQAALDLVSVQVGKLTITAPMAGVVLRSSIHPGEIIQPGAGAIILGNLEHLTITVYIPEDRYGEVNLGDEADVHVDSFPGETFTAEVTRISDQAEFTPRNVQTVEGRSTTVYAIQLAVQDPQGKLKPGMPADVTFDISH